MFMGSAEVDGVDICHFGLTAPRIFELAAHHDSILCCLVVAMNQMDTKSLMSVMADEMFLQDGWLFSIVEQPIVASNC